MIVQSHSEGTRHDASLKADADDAMTTHFLSASSSSSPLSVNAGQPQVWESTKSCEYEISLARARVLVSNARCSIINNE